MKLLGNQVQASFSDIGVIQYYAKNEIPAGWLECAGQLVLRSAYPVLFAKISTVYNTGGEDGTNFRLPDLRGEFIRGADNGRGIDTGRVFGSYQADEFKSHDHNINKDTRGAGVGTLEAIGPSSSGTNTTAVQATGGTETRPRNVAMLPCIRSY